MLVPVCDGVLPATKMLPAASPHHRCVASTATAVGEPACGTTVVGAPPLLATTSTRWSAAKKTEAASTATPCGAVCICASVVSAPAPLLSMASSVESEVQ